MNRFIISGLGDHQESEASSRGAAALDLAALDPATLDLATLDLATLGPFVHTLTHLCSV